MGIIINNEDMHRSMRSSVYLDDGTCRTVEYCESVYIRDEQPVKDDELCIDIGFDIYKARDDEGLVSGWANVAINADGSIPFDWDGDVVAPEELEKAAITFMKNYRESGEMHNGDSKGTVVESIVFTKDKQEALGIPEGLVPQGWFITVKIDDADTFAKVKDGTYKMFSIQGTGKRVKI